jgi:hypothetical protein
MRFLCIDNPSKAEGVPPTPETDIRGPRGRVFRPWGGAPPALRTAREIAQPTLAAK